MVVKLRDPREKDRQVHSSTRRGTWLVMAMSVQDSMIDVVGSSPAAENYGPV